jgi:hypothetical protein
MAFGERGRRHLLIAWLGFIVISAALLGFTGHVDRGRALPSNDSPSASSSGPHISSGGYVSVGAPSWASSVVLVLFCAVIVYTALGSRRHRQ